MNTGPVMPPRDPAEEWADQYCIAPFRPAHLCLRWIGEKGRCRRYCEPMPTSWGDHPSAWRDEHKRPALILFQPYNFASGYLDLRDRLKAWPQLHLRFERADGGWHSPRASLVEVWRDAETYERLRK